MLNAAMTARNSTALKERCGLSPASAWRRRVLAAAFLLCIGLPRLGITASPVLEGHVVKVVDGDTLDVQLDSGKIRVRLYAVDAPEKAQPHGKDATDALVRIVGNRVVQIEPFEQDRYDRIVAIVFIGQLNVNAELIREGHAWAYRRYMKKADAMLCNFEAAARSRRSGLWAAPADEIEAPWEWRNKKLEYVTDYSQETAADCTASIGMR